jgi:hypothetical protein
VNYNDWVKLSDPDKIDSLREEVLGVKRLLQFGVAISAALGTVFGSVATLFLQHLMTAVK